MPTVSISRPAVCRGEVWLVALDPIIGSEQTKTRPCVIVQRDAANRVGRTTIVVPVTDAAGRTESAIAPKIPAGVAGLEKASSVLCHQIRAVDRQRFRKKLGTLNAHAMARIEAGLIAILDFDEHAPPKL